MNSDKVNPYAEKEKVRGMFNSIAPSYDFLNSFLSLGIHKRWKKRLIKKIALRNPQQILDVASGTCDLAILAARLKPQRIIALDLSEKMLDAGKLKIEKKGLSGLIETLVGDAAQIPFGDETFDAAMVGFGVRNFEQPVVGMREIFRVLKPGSIFCVLEFSHPRKTPLKQLYHFYFTKILPLIGKVVSRNNAAYHYLPNSVGNFASRQDFVDLMEQAGFKKARYQTLSLGIACLYIAEK